MQLRSQRVEERPSTHAVLNGALTASRESCGRASGANDLTKKARLAASVPIVTVLCVGLTDGASAQTEITTGDFEDAGWSGEMSLAGSAKTGNTESTDLAVEGSVGYDTSRWRHLFGATYDWGSADGTDTKNRFATSYEAARLLNHRLYGFGRGAYELDEFDGYDYRAIVGGGLGYDVLAGDVRSWSVQAGPAYRHDEVEAVFDDMDMLLAPAETQTSIALILGSRFEAQINEAVDFSNDTDVTSSEDTTTIFNRAALTAELTGGFSARFSLEAAHDTSPPLGAEATDTTTRAALVYAFGGD
ncbi:MAG: DUF481 domain-containing protein [Maricaulaceae bacterium]|jgi:putative salt-induced outer membrane protein